jgi:hypothetical protein
MIASTQLLAVGTGKCTASGRLFGRLFRSIRKRISVWATTSADYFAAAGAYEELSRLSDQELQRRGFSRATLARDVCTAFDGSQRAPSDGIHEPFVQIARLTERRLDRRPRW